MADTRQTGSNVAPLWCAKVCDHTQRPYIWTQAIRSKISAENTCKWEPMVCTAPSRRGGISSVNCNEGGCYAGRSNRFDSAKCVFEVHGVDSHGKVVVRKTLRRDAVARFFANLPPCLVGMEASNGAHYWARVLTNLGHEVRLISPQFVKPYVKSNKNDRNDAEAICEAVGRPSMRFVPPKSTDQLAVQAVHRIRRRLVADRVRLVAAVALANKNARIVGHARAAHATNTHLQ